MFVYVDSNFTDVCSVGYDKPWIIISSGNGLAPNRRQAIAWTNDDPVHGCLYVAPELSELMIDLYTF